MANLTGSRSSFPSQVDSFREISDLPASKKIQAKRFQQLKTQEVLSPAEVSELNSLQTELQDFIISPEYLNTALDSIINLQNFFNENTVGYIQTKQAEMQTEIDKFNNKGTFNISTQYYKNNFVDFNDGSSNQTYICLQDCLGKEPSSNPTFWKKLTIQGQRGETGANGANFVFKGAYDIATTYIKDEAVQYGGVLFVSKINGNVGNEPNLIAETAAWVKGLDLTVTSSKLIGTRNVVTQTSNVNFIVGEITSFNPSVDSLEVFMNSTGLTSRLTKGKDYTINANNQSIDKVSGTWNGSVGTPVFFEFVVTKNIINNLIFKDGSALSNGTVTLNKLDTDTQAKINLVPSMTEDIITINSELANKVDESEIDNLVSAEAVLTKIKTVDGTTSGLDADLLDGKHASEFATNDHAHTVATQADVDAGTSNTLYVTPLGLAGLKQSVVNGKQEVVNAINGIVGTSGLTTENPHEDYAWWITNRVATEMSFYGLTPQPLFADGLANPNLVSSYSGGTIMGTVLRRASGEAISFTLTGMTTSKTLFVKVTTISGSGATLSINTANTLKAIGINVNSVRYGTGAGSFTLTQINGIRMFEHYDGSAPSTKVSLNGKTITISSTGTDVCDLEFFVIE